MLNQFFLLELFSSILLIRDTCMSVVENLLRTAVEGGEMKSDPNATKNAMYLPADPGDTDENPYDRLEKNSVAIIPLSGLMMKNRYWWHHTGCDELAQLIRLADLSPNIAGTVLLLDTPGGATTAVIQLEDAMRNRTKPCVGLIDSSCNSGGIYVASFCDELHAMNRMCEAGSIGTYAQIVDTRESDKKWGYKIEQIYPPESKYKNLEVREALAGKPERLIRETLTPYAIHFQNIIKENRPKLDTSVEGILEGRVFYAYDAITNGLIDGLMNLEQAVARVRSLAADRQSFYSQFK
jgi:protease-4